MSAGPATALLAAAAIAAFLIDGIAALAAMTVDPARDLPARPGAATLAVHRRRAAQRARGDRDLAADVVVGRRHAALGRADASRDRAARPLDRRDPDRDRQRPPARRRRPRVQRVHPARRPRSAGLGGGVRAPVGAGRRPRDPSRPEPRAGRGRASPSRCAAGASSFTGCAGTRCCSRRSSPVRSSARRAWPRRWRRGASGAARRRARHVPPGRGSTTSRSSAAVALVAVAYGCSRVEGLSFAYPGGAPAVRDVSLELQRGRGRRVARPVRQRQVDALARAGRARAAFPRRPLRRPGRGRRPGHADARPAELAGTVSSVFQDPGEPGRDDARRERGRVRSREHRRRARADLAAGRRRARRSRGVAARGPAHGRAFGRGAAARLPRLGARAATAAAAARRADVPARRRGRRGVSRCGRAGALCGRALRAARRPRTRDRRPGDHDGGGTHRPRRPCRGGARLALGCTGRGTPAGSSRHDPAPRARAARRWSGSKRSTSPTAKGPDGPRRASRSASIAARSSRSRGRTEAARRRLRRSPRGSSSRRAGSSPGADERRTSPRIPAGTWSARPRSTRLRSASAATRCGRPRLSSSSAWRSRRAGIRATSRAASGSASASPPSRYPSPICSCSTSPRAGSTRIARRRSPRGCSSRPRRVAACSSRRTIRCCPRIAGCGSAHPWRCPLRSRLALVAFVALGLAGVALGGARSRGRRPRDAARGVRARRRRVRLAGAGRRHRPRSHARGHARRHRRRRARAVRADSRACSP